MAAKKAMGLIMLILIGIAPTAYALSRTMPDASTPAFLEITNKARCRTAARICPANAAHP
jgi:PiT family inorganic phosphate transporter